MLLEYLCFVLCIHARLYACLICTACMAGLAEMIFTWCEMWTRSANVNQIGLVKCEPNRPNYINVKCSLADLYALRYHRCVYLAWPMVRMEAVTLASPQVQPHECTHTHTHTRTHTQTHTLVHTHKHAHIHTYTHKARNIVGVYALCTTLSHHRSSKLWHLQTS